MCTFQGGVNAAGMQYAYAGMAQAFEDGSPVLCITDGVPAGSSGNSQYDVASAMKTVSKWFGYLDKPERTPELMRRAFTMLRSGRPGPVILAIPNATATYDETADPYHPVKGWKSAPDPADVRAAVDQLLRARNPLIYAGEGVIYAGAAEELKALAELVNVPVITTLKAKGAFPEDHPLFVGVRGDQVAHYLNQSDTDPRHRLEPVAGPLQPRHSRSGEEDHHPLQRRRIAHQQDVSDGACGDRRCAPDLAGAMPGSVRPHVGRHGRRRTECGRCGGGSEGGARHRARPIPAGHELRRDADQPLSGVWRSDGGAGSEEFVRDARKRQHPRPASTVFDTLIPRGFLGWGNVSTLGFSLAAAIAAKKAFPERASVAVTGEAGLGYMLGNLEVLLREKLGVTVVHISNGGFAGYGPGFWGPGHDPFTHRVLGPDEVDMSKVIGALGFHTERVSEPAEIIPALRRAFEINNSGRPAYIEFICCQYPVYGQWVGRGE